METKKLLKQKKPLEIKIQAAMRTSEYKAAETLNFIPYIPDQPLVDPSDDEILVRLEREQIAYQLKKLRK